MTMAELWTCNLGTLEYRAAAELQESLRERVVAGELPDLLLLLEHPPVYTLGRRSEPGDLPFGERLARARDRRRRDAARRQADLPRAGPARRLSDHASATCPAFVRTMEGALVAALAEQRIDSRGRDHEGAAYTGVWVQERKIASIGVHISRGVSAHGFALNVDNDVAAVPPGHRLRAAGRPHDLGRARVRRAGTLPCMRKRVAYAFAQAHGMRQRIVTPRRRHRDRRAARTGTLVDVSSAAPRLHVTRSRANPGGMDVMKVLGTDTLPFRGRKPRGSRCRRPAAGATAS